MSQTLLKAFAIFVWPLIFSALLFVLEPRLHLVKAFGMLNYVLISLPGCLAIMSQKIFERTGAIFLTLLYLVIMYVLIFMSSSMALHHFF